MVAIEIPCFTTITADMIFFCGSQQKVNRKIVSETAEVFFFLWPFFHSFYFLSDPRDSKYLELISKTKIRDFFIFFQEKLWPAVIKNKTKTFQRHCDFQKSNKMKWEFILWNNRDINVEKKCFFGRPGGIKMFFMFKTGTILFYFRLLHNRLITCKELNHLG